MSEESRSLHITAVRVFPFDTRESGGKVVAYAEIEVDGVLLLKGIRILESDKRGLFLGFPSQRARQDRFVDLIEVLTREARAQVREAGIGEYKRLTGWEPVRGEADRPE